MLKIENLQVHYGGIQALRGISLEVPDGRIVTLIGANGAGKSTTLRTITGLVKASGGSVQWDGQELLGKSIDKIISTGIAMSPEGRRVFPDMTVLLFFIIPIKIKWLAIIDGAFFAIEIVGAILSRNVVGAITPVLALLNFALFATPYIHYIRRRTQYRHSAGAVNFRRTVHQAQKQQQTAPYHHKCAVCGRTDTDYPDLQFRYCSKCAGYHCFCQDHIFSHVHFTEEP